MAAKGKTEVILSIIINAVLPYLTYHFLIKYTSSVTALSIAALIPLLDSLLSLVRTRKVDVFSTFIFIGLVLSLIAALIGGDEKFILIRESYVTGIMGFIFLASLLFGKPLIYHFAKRFAGDKTKAITQWEYPNYRRVIRLMTLVWGLSLLLEASVKVMLVYNLSISQFLAVSPICMYGILGLTILWTVKYTQAMRKKFG
jgi:intracellular septation protein A